MQLLFFGSLKEVFNTGRMDWPHPATSLGELQSLLENAYPFLKSHKYMFAVNEDLIRNPEHPLQAGDIVALLPPFSGG